MKSDKEMSTNEFLDNLNDNLEKIGLAPSQEALEVIEHKLEKDEEIIIKDAQKCLKELKAEKKKKKIFNKKKISFYIIAGK